MSLDILQTQTKFCKYCKCNIEITNFPKRPKNKDGLDTYCRSCNTIKGRLWNQSNREKRQEINKKYSKDNREKVLADGRKWYRENADRVKKNVAKRTQEREKEDINFKLARRLRSRMCSALKRGYKTGSAVDDLGCSIDFFKKYLESLFDHGMTWENYGKWEIDHIEPLASVNLSDPEVFKRVANYKNQRPLWKQHNLDRRFNGKTKKNN